MYSTSNWPCQSISYKKKTKKWAEDCVRYLSNNTVLNSTMVRKTVSHKKINYDLLSGKLDMNDLKIAINPENQDTGLPISKIQHYPIINSKLMLLLGEERAAQFDYRVVITNPNAISDIEKNKQAELQELILKQIQDTSLTEDQFQANLQGVEDYMEYDWQDLREIRANCLINHYWKELNMPALFNDGYADGLVNNEEIYQCCIVGGEPTIQKLNPMKVHIYKSGYSNKVEDADMIVIEDYWSPGRIIDTFFDQLSAADIKKIEEYNTRFNSSNGKEDPRDWFIWGDQADQIKEYALDDNNGVWLSFIDGINSSNLPYDIAGNIRVIQCFWKSLKKVKKVKRYNPVTGDSEYEIFSENYIPDEDKGEESKNLVINEAWQGVMIGAGEDAIILNCRPCPVQYNSMSNPSKCHFGIIGTIYNFNDSQPYSLVDMMKPYSYLYDVIKDRLNKLLARNYGKIMQMNPAMIPTGWSIDKWLYYIKANGIAFVDPFNEAMSGKPAGSIQLSPTLDLELGNSIQFYLNLLEAIKGEIGEIAGISKQREGQIANRETVGGVERSTLQSAHTTRWYSAKHDDTKKRVLECFIETAKCAMKGKSKKFEYITPDNSRKIMEIDGDEFAEADYGLVVDSNYDIQQMQQDIKMVAQAEAQNGMIKFSTYLKILQNCSIADKIKILEKEERRMEEQAQQKQQMEVQAAQQQQQMEAQSKQIDRQLKDQLNQRDNETKILVAQISADNQQKLKEMDVDGDGVVEPSPLEMASLEEKIREFDKKMELDKQKLEFDKQKHSEDNALKLQIARMKPKTTTNK